MDAHWQVHYNQKNHFLEASDQRSWAAWSPDCSQMWSSQPVYDRCSARRFAMRTFPADALVCSVCFSGPRSWPSFGSRPAVKSDCKITTILQAAYFLGLVQLYAVGSKSLSRCAEISVGCRKWCPCSAAGCGNSSLSLIRDPYALVTFIACCYASGCSSEHRDGPLLRYVVRSTRYPAGSQILKAEYAHNPSRFSALSSWWIDWNHMKKSTTNLKQHLPQFIFLASSFHPYPSVSSAGSKSRLMVSSRGRMCELGVTDYQMN